MTVLVLNAGSSSLKYDLWQTDPEKMLSRDSIERVGSMADALKAAFKKLGNVAIDAVGHRIVHGGDIFHSAVVIDAEVEKQIEELCILAPLHNPHNLEGVRAARAHLPNVTHVAVFDTAFHCTLPPHAYAYGLPYEYLEQKKIRRYGFHGISHRYIASCFPPDHRVISCHLGNGCSVCAIDHGKSIDTSMGFTPLEGLVMGTRSGDVDAGAILHLITHEKEDPSKVLLMLNEDSGLKGLSGISNDMRDVLKASAEGNQRAKLAFDTFCYRVKKYIGAYLAVMNGADTLVFTGGIGENSAETRERICTGLEVPVQVIAAQEELMIARDTRGLIVR